MKINLYKVLAVNVLGLFLFSCDSEDFTGKATFEPTAGVNISIAPVGTIASTYSEVSEDTIRVTAVLNEMQEKADIVLYAIQTGGNATLGEDVEFINEDGKGFAKKLIPANSGTQVTWTLVVLNDCVNEESETIELQFGDVRTANASLTPVEVSFAISNFRSDIPTVTMEWGNDEDGEPIVFGYGDNAQAVEDIDLDILLLDEDGNDLGNYTAATGSVPEVLTFSDADGNVLPDGDYIIYVDIYDTWTTGEGFGPVEYPVFFNFSRCGAALNTSTIAEGFKTSGYGADNTGFAALYTVTLSGSTITVNDGVADIGQGSIDKIRASIDELRLNK